MAITTPIDLTCTTLAELSERIRGGHVSPLRVAEDCLRRIDRLNPTLNAFITVTAELAQDQARQAATEIASGRWRGPLHGVPVAVKDFYDTAGIRTTAGFEHFRERVPQEDAQLVVALRDAGAVLVGKTNMHKLGMGTTSLDSHFGPVVNPRSRHHVAGGSSGGSAAAVAAGLCYATVDTDAIGSGRLPAAVCGVTCHKPTFGLLSSVGILAGEPVDPAILTLGHPCVMARSAHDVALALEAIVAAATTATTRLRASARPVQGWRVGVARNFVADDAIRRGFMAVVDVVAGMQVTAVEIDVPFASASFDLTRVEQDRATIDTSLFGDLSVIVLPTLTAPAPTIADARAMGDMAVSPQNTFFANYFGLPAVSVPAGLHDDTSTPTGVQFVGPHGGDADVLALAAAYQSATA